jgi:hypothetical protein
MASASILQQGKALFAWNGSEWIPLNGGTNFSTIQRWSKVFEGGETSISGNDSQENLLIYTPGYEQVYLNGILLVRNEDYTATDGVEINLSSPLSEDDVLDIIIFIPVNIANIYTRQQSDAKFSTVEDLENIDLSPYLTIEDAEDIYLDIESASATYVAKTDTELIKYGSSEPDSPEEGTVWIDSTNIEKPITKVYNGSGWVIVSGADSSLNPFLLMGA